MPMRRISLTVSILAFLSCLLLATWFLFSLLAYKTAANDLYSQKAEHTRMLLATFVQQLPDTIPVLPAGMIDSNTPAATFARNISSDPSFVRLTLLDSNSKPVFTVGKAGVDVYQPFADLQPGRETGCSFSAGEVRCITKLGRGNAEVGTAGLALSMSNENSRLNRSRTLYMAYFAIDFILLVGLGAFILSRIVVTPLHRLLAATDKITGGQYGQRVRISGSAELVDLAESFNAMSLTLQQKELQVQQHLAALQQANDELHRAREEAIRTEKMASIGLLAAGMAHEIGTPLAAITGYAELTATEELDADTAREYGRRIALDCSRIDRIVRGLLDYARPRGTVMERCFLPPLLEETIQLLSGQGVLKTVEVELQCDQNLPAAAVDPHQLQQVLINLIINARDAMPQGGTITIHATTETAGQSPFAAAATLCIKVSDCGSGIKPEHIKQIFDPFFTTKEPGKGTGLGLAISSRIVEGFGGTITVTSQPGMGTVFSLFLPGAAS